jgi:hypothetical protein
MALTELRTSTFFWVLSLNTIVCYGLSDPTVDSQMVSLKASGADAFLNIATAKLAAQAICKAYDIGWRSLQ